MIKVPIEPEGKAGVQKGDVDPTLGEPWKNRKFSRRMFKVGSTSPLTAFKWQKRWVWGRVPTIADPQNVRKSNKYFLQNFTEMQNNSIIC